MESVAQAVSNLAIQFGDSDDDAGVMSRCSSFLHHTTTFVVILLLPICSQTIWRCNPLCWDGRQRDSTLPHGSQWHIPSGGTFAMNMQCVTVTLSPLIRLQLWSNCYAFQFDAKAIGSGSEGAQQSLQEVWILGNTPKELNLKKKPSKYSPNITFK